MKYVLKNAQENEKSGLNVNRVVEVIMRADSAKNPKVSYTVGRDALFARIMSKLPQSIINKIVKVGIKYKVRQGQTLS